MKKKFGGETKLGKRRTDIAEAPVVVDVPRDAHIEREAITVFFSEKGWVRAVGGHDVDPASVKYKEGEKKLLVTPQTVVVTYVPGNKDDLKPGTKIFVSAAKKQPDGTLQTPRITYGRDGAGPAF